MATRRVASKEAKAAAKAASQMLQMVQVSAMGVLPATGLRKVSLLARILLAKYVEERIISLLHVIIEIRNASNATRPGTSLAYVFVRLAGPRMVL